MTSHRRPDDITRVRWRQLQPLGVACVLLAAGGCATPPPSDALQDARETYAEAKKSRAAELAPARLLTAKQRLQQAERDYIEEPRSAEERHDAYVAQRLAQIAMAHAEMVGAQQDEKSAEKQYAELQARGRQRTEDELARVRQKLAALRARIQEKTEGDSAELEQELAELQKREAALKSAMETTTAKLTQARQKAQKALDRLSEIAKVKREQQQTVITLSGAVLFASGKSELLPSARRRLLKVAEALKAQEDGERFIIEGHTDSRGSAAFNRQLSRARAEAVRTFLINAGVDADRLAAVGQGETDPVATNATAAGRANNRRVEIIVKPQPAAAARREAIEKSRGSRGG